MFNMINFDRCIYHRTYSIILWFWKSSLSLKLFCLLFQIFYYILWMGRNIDKDHFFKTVPLPSNLYTCFSKWLCSYHQCLADIPQTSHLGAMQVNFKGHFHIAVPSFSPPYLRKATISAGLARSAGELAKPRSISINDSWELESKYHSSLTPEVETLWVFIVSQSPTWNSAPVAHSDNSLNNPFMASFLPDLPSLTSVIGVFITYQTTCTSAFVSGFASREPKLRWSSTIHL